MDTSADDSTAEGSAALQTPQTPSPRRVPVVFDTDVDFDDSAALAYLVGLHKRGDIELRLVTVTSAGAGLPGGAVRNARCLLDRFGVPEIPVADSRTAGKNEFPALLRLGVDMVLSDLLQGCTASDAPSRVPAESALVEELLRPGVPAVLVTTGPLTNIAGAVTLARRRGIPLATRIRSAFVMGGAVRVPGNLCCGLDASLDGTQELNMWADPGAAQSVFEHLLPAQISLVPLDATRFVPVRQEFATRLAQVTFTPEAAYVSALLQHPAIAGAIAAGQAPFWWDPLDAVAGTERGVVEFDLERIQVVQDGTSEGRTLEVRRPSGDTSFLRFGVSAEQDLFERDFIAGLLARRPPFSWASTN